MKNLTIPILLLLLLVVDNLGEEITTKNLHSILESNEVVLVNFYANWCRFSQQLNPIYDQLEERIRKEYPTPGIVAVGKVDCDAEGSIATKYGVKKYPTLKLFRHGLLVKREYRGARQIDALVEYLHDQISSSILHFSNLVELFNRSSLIVGEFSSNDSIRYETFVKVANLLRDQCSFGLSLNRSDSVSFHSSGIRLFDLPLELLSSAERFYQWADEKCSPTVRKLSFDNAEELTDEGLPFLLLFHRSTDHQSLKTFTERVNRDLLHQRTLINCLHADGEQFGHALNHLGKSLNDLPLLIIDSFEDIFVFPHFAEIDVDDRLSSFVRDFQSGELHRTFHNPTTKKSVFVRLAPSRQHEFSGMNLEEFLNWTISIDCGLDRGTFQGQIQSVDQFNQTLRLKNAFHNGVLLHHDEEHSVLIQAKHIRDLNLLSQPTNYTFQLPKSNSKKFHPEQQQQQQTQTSKPAPIASNPSTVEEKYRCDQMILEHNNGPIDYEQIVLPVPTSKKYRTDEGLLVPAINVDLRNRLFASAEHSGYSVERRIESMGRCTSEMCLHLLGGSQRLLMKNRHQHPIIVVLACSTEISGAYAICAARILATKNMRIVLFLPPNCSRENSFVENELKLFRTTQSTITDQVNDLPRSPVDLLLNGLDGANNSDSILFAKPWYREIVQYCSRLQTSIIAIDPPLDGGAIECKYSLVPLLPLLPTSSKNAGRIYLCDLAFGKAVFQHLQIRYASPFGAKSFVALHDN